MTKRTNQSAESKHDTAKKNRKSYPDIPAQQPDHELDAREHQPGSEEAGKKDVAPENDGGEQVLSGRPRETGGDRPPGPATQRHA